MIIINVIEIFRLLDFQCNLIENDKKNRKFYKILI